MSEINYEVRPSWNSVKDSLPVVVSNPESDDSGVGVLVANFETGATHRATYWKKAGFEIDKGKILYCMKNDDFGKMFRAEHDDNPIWFEPKHVTHWALDEIHIAPPDEE